MRAVFRTRRSKDAQTFVFFALTFGTIFLLCGLAIDSGLLFLAKARMSRSVDGATLAAVGNFNNSGTVTNPQPADIRDHVANIMRNFAVANYTDLGASHTHYGFVDNPITATITGGGTKSQFTATNGSIGYNYTYNYNDGTKDPNGQYRKFVQVVLTTGAGGQITSATCSSRCPVGTYFIGALAPFFRDLKVSSSSVATRNPRLIVIVVDRSGSMLAGGGGAYGLPQAIVQFLDFFDTSSDYISIVSFGSSARVEMPLTTNFIIAGTNILFNSYQITNAGSATPYGVPGLDPEDTPGSGDYDSSYATAGVRRLKFGGTTAADEGMRLGMEQLMANSGFNDPDVVKYMVLFTDGAWNETRTLLAAPPYTNITLGPTNLATSILTNPSPWSTNIVSDTNLVMVPTFCEATSVTNLLNSIDYFNQANDFTPLVPFHTNDIFQSIAALDTGAEPVTTTQAATGVYFEGKPITITNAGIVGNIGGTNFYARDIDVWLQPGAVDYEYQSNTIIATYVSDLTNPTKHVWIEQLDGESNMLVVPGYLVDGLFFDNLDLTLPDTLNWNGTGTPNDYPRYRINNFQEYFMWTDDMTPISSPTDAGNYTKGNSLQRQLMFRNYPNLLTGFYVTRPDEPDGPAGDIDTFTGAIRPSYGLGAYYPAAGFYWPFDLVGVDVYQNYMLTNAAFDPDPLYSQGSYGGSRHESYSINMLSAAAAPRWSGEWFYEGTNGMNTTSSPGNTALSTMMTTKAQWQAGAPSWLITDFDAPGETIMTNETAHNTNIIPSAQVWRPSSFQGTLLETSTAFRTPAQIVHDNNQQSHTGGYVVDGSTGAVYTDSMAWNGRPTHYFDFSTSRWIPIVSNHTTNLQALPLGFWKVQEYAWHARATGVTIYSVGYGQKVGLAQQVILAQVANATNTTAGNTQYLDSTGTNYVYIDTGGSNIPYNSSQPIGQEFFANSVDDISNDFYQVGTAINAALTQ